MGQAEQSSGQNPEADLAATLQFLRDKIDRRWTRFDRAQRRAFDLIADSGTRKAVNRMRSISDGLEVTRRDELWTSALLRILPPETILQALDALNREAKERNAARQEPTERRDPSSLEEQLGRGDPEAEIDARISALETLFAFRERERDAARSHFYETVETVLDDPLLTDEQRFDRITATARDWVVAAINREETRTDRLWHHVTFEGSDDKDGVVDAWDAKSDLASEIEDNQHQEKDGQEE